jgi:hypothetical protein
MNAAIFWDTVPCRQNVNQRFGGTYHLHLQGRKSIEEKTSTCQHDGFLLDWFSTVVMEVMRSSETLVHIRTKQRRES